MRALIALPLLALALAGCKVTKDDANGSVTAEFNGDIAQNGFDDATNFAGNVAEDIGNDVEQTADKIDNTDVDIDTDGNSAN